MWIARALRASLEPAGQYAVRRKAAVDGGHHYLVDHAKVVPDLRTFRILDKLPKGNARACRGGYDLIHVAVAVDALGWHFSALLAERPASDRVYLPVAEFGAVCAKGREKHAVGMKLIVCVGLPDYLGALRAQSILDGLVGEVAAPSGGEGIEKHDLVSGRIREAAQKFGGGIYRTHRVA